MQWQGYDAVMPFNWVKTATPRTRRASKGRSWPRRINAIAEQFPESAVVDLHVVGHSEGTTSTAWRSGSPNDGAARVAEDFIQDTISNRTPPTTTRPGSSARRTRSSGRSRSRSSPAPGGRRRSGGVRPGGRGCGRGSSTSIRWSQDTHDGGEYNLWGQVPVPNHSGRPVHYYNLTATGASHSGTLRRGALVSQLRRDDPPQPGTAGPGTPARRRARRAHSIDRGSGEQGRGMPRRQLGSRSGPSTATRPTFSGTARTGLDRCGSYVARRPRPRPGSAYRDRHSRRRRNLEDQHPPPLPDGRYRAVVMAYSRALHTRPAYAVVPWLRWAGS